MNFILKSFGELSREEIASLKQNDLFKKSQANWKYSEGNITYNFEYFGDNYQNKSFVAFVGNTVAAYAFIAMEREVSFFNMPIDVYIDKSQVSKKLSSLILEYLRKLANGNLIRLYYNPFLAYQIGSTDEMKFSSREEFSYKIDLDQSLQEIRGGFRKSYKSLVNSCIKRIEYLYVDKRNPDNGAFNEFREFHAKTAGKLTRSLRSWELQRELISNGDAFLINGYYQNKLVSSSYFLGTKEIYYGVAVYDREMMSQNISLGHGSIYKAIEYLKDLGAKSLNLGYWETDTELTEKEQHIQNFKRGFTISLNVKNILIIKNEVQG